MTILTIEQYESAKGLLNLLSKIIKPTSLKKFQRFILVEEPCRNCSNLPEDCYCLDDAPNYYAEYDDEASFE